jgi:hypothetical protein
MICSLCRVGRGLAEMPQFLREEVISTTLMVDAVPLSLRGMMMMIMTPMEICRPRFLSTWSKKYVPIVATVTSHVDAQRKQV